jgi:CubicO group peptidase (beta-lactamase class C family)
VVAVDPVASLRICSAIVTISGTEYEVEGHSAADWIEAMLAGGMNRIIPGWLVDGQRELMDQLLDGTIEDEDLNEATLEALTVAGGRPYWWIANMVGMASSTNTFWGILNGRLLLGGVHASAVSLSAWIDALYSCMVDNMDEETRLKFDSHIDMPPAGIPIDEEEEGAAFMALLAGSSMGDL